MYVCTYVHTHVYLILAGICVHGELCLKYTLCFLIWHPEQWQRDTEENGIISVCVCVCVCVHTWHLNTLDHIAATGCTPVGQNFGRIASTQKGRRREFSPEDAAYLYVSHLVCTL